MPETFFSTSFQIGRALLNHQIMGLTHRLHVLSTLHTARGRGFAL